MFAVFSSATGRAAEHIADSERKLFSNAVDESWAIARTWQDVSDEENYLADGVRGIAVTSVDNNNGSWQYSINNRSSWVAFGSVSASSVRLLDGSNSQHHIRFIPTADYFGSSS